jgi:hypothetical protein
MRDAVDDLGNVGKRTDKMLAALDKYHKHKL